MIHSTLDSNKVLYDFFFFFLLGKLINSLYNFLGLFFIFIVYDFSKSRVDRIRTFKEIGCFFAGKGIEGEGANQRALKKRKIAPKFC
jgi:hypothetical protein